MMCTKKHSKEESMNFEFHNPTHLIFGAGTLSQLGQVASKFGKKAVADGSDLEARARCSGRRSSP